MEINRYKLLIYTNAFIIGFIIMSFEMIGSRYLNPYFGSSIFTWASIITVVMIALTIGYFIGGKIADKFPSSKILGGIVIIVFFFLILVPYYNESLLDTIFNITDDVRYGSFLGASSILLLPLLLMGIYSPFAIRLIVLSIDDAGKTAGNIYGIATLGSVAGTLFTTFYLIPIMGVDQITFILSFITLLSGLSLIFNKQKGNN
jgi:MFS family permease